jgi:aminoglycoside phosphotransferase (APT) family kinase protein
VPSGTQRDLHELGPKVLAWLRDRHPERADLGIDGLRHASAGLTNESVLVDCSWDGGGHVESLVLRLPAQQTTFPDFDLGVEARVQEALGRAGVPTPVPAHFERDPRWLGAPFLAMPFVPGQVGPQAPAFDPWIASLTPRQQRGVYDSFLDVVARVHTVDARAARLDDALRGADRTVADEVQWWEEYARWTAGGGTPNSILAELLSWCRVNVPSSEPAPSVLWGDPRLGNAIFGDDQRLVAALDWDMAFIGPAEHDIGWYLGLEGVMNEIAGRAVEGFPSREEALAIYERRLGRRLADYEWYEIFALVRSVAITVRQIRIAAEAKVEYLVPAPEKSPVVPYIRALIARAG